MPFDLDETGPRFPGEFRLVPKAGHVPAAAEQAYLDTLEGVMDALADDEADDPTGDDPASRALAEERKKVRRFRLGELKGQAQEFIASGLAANIADDNALVIKGKYVRDRDHLSESLFVVSEAIDRQTQMATELLIGVSAGLPPPNDAPTPEQNALFVAIQEVQTVIATVCERITNDAGTRWLRTKTQRDSERARAGRILDRYIRKLAGIGRLGLEGPHVALGNLALTGLKSEFVAQEAARIKNGYIRKLGFTTGIAALIFFLLYWYATTASAGSFLGTYKVFFLAAGGASIGTWLSFSIRRVTLAFNELGVIEEDLLEPWVRVLFVVALTVTICLLFWTKALNIEIGLLKTADLKTAPAVGLLVGLFCGISERALATAVSGRAATFVKGLGG